MARRNAKQIKSWVELSKINTRYKINQDLSGYRRAIKATPGYYIKQSKINLPDSEFELMTAQNKKK